LGMELKVWRDGDRDPLQAGLGLDTGWLILFDRRTGQPPLAERTTRHEQLSPQGRRIQVVRAQ